MKKLLAWVICLFVAALITNAIPGWVRGEEQYFTLEEARKNAQIVGAATVAVNACAIGIAAALTRSISNKQRIQKAMEETRLRQLEAEQAAQAELEGAVSMLPVPGMPDYGECPVCRCRNHVGKQSCFQCGTPLKKTLAPGDPQ